MIGWKERTKEADRSTRINDGAVWQSCTAIKTGKKYFNLCKVLGRRHAALKKGISLFLQFAPTGSVISSGAS